MNRIKYIAVAFFCLFAARVSAQALLPEMHSEISKEKSDMSKLVTTTFLDQSLEDVSKYSPFAGIADLVTPPQVQPQLAHSMVNYAAKFLGTRYLLGGTTPRAFDCSGFVGYVYRNFGINLLRTSRQQFTQGDKVNVGELQPGDLLFFSCRSSGRGNVGHVAMVVSVDKESKSCRFIHASVKKGVTYQKFPDGGYFSRNFIGAKRILGTELDVASRNTKSGNTAQR